MNEHPGSDVTGSTEGNVIDSSWYTSRLPDLTLPRVIFDIVFFSVVTDSKGESPYVTIYKDIRHQKISMRAINVIYCPPPVLSRAENIVRKV